ncbi:LysR family transcriptional regulator [Brumimicrobium oceani]|uniref:HTH lysR-type domain-containing protein n=1 Tax=Brumimicrobium oceani TaxID=2100725 RepID=A0A2U2X1A8_9FLAO|nr:LysR family transcriptional regulator [Brumimicrobium oceani]PWH81549.1 hypothetical protein DIT68_14565 [Brumimicrobium oceani]
MNINQLKYITAIDQHRHFTRAAESCDIAQSTLSREVQKLEQELDVIIFDRSRSPVVPTQKGKSLILIANKILTKIETFELTAKQLDNSKAQSFNLGIWSCIAPYILPTFLESFTQKYQNINLNITELNLQDIQEKFNELRLDGCILPDSVQKPGFYQSLLYEETFKIYNHSQPKNGLENNRGLIHIDLKGASESLLVNEKASNLKPKSYPSLTYQKCSIETIRKIIEYNGGISVLPVSFLRDKDKREKRKAFFEKPSHKIKINFVTPRFYEKEEIIQSIKKEFKTLFLSEKKEI